MMPGLVSATPVVFRKRFSYAAFFFALSISIIRKTLTEIALLSSDKETKKHLEHMISKYIFHYTKGYYTVTQFKIIFLYVVSTTQ